LQSFGSNTWANLFLLLIAIFGLWRLIRSFRRWLAMRSLAKRIGLAYRGDTLPAALDGVETIPTSVTRFSNVIDGQLNGIRVVAFDYGQGTRTLGYKGTAIAAKTDGDLFRTIPKNQGFTLERSEGWIVLHQPNGYNWPGEILSVRALEKMLRTLG